MVLLLLILSANGRVNATFYTYHKVGTYSINDFYLNYVLRRYDFRLALEKRQNEFGLKSITLEIDSVLGQYRLALGERPYHIEAPVSTNLNLWGVTLISRDLDLFFGKERDYTSALPPTFEQNRYTIGARLHRQLSYRVPLDFYILRRSDSPSPNRTSGNNALGVNSKLVLGKRLLLGSRLWASHTEQGIGASFTLNGRYTTQKYGGHFFLTTMTSDYVALSSIKVRRGTWLRLTSYQNPVDWLGFSQDLAYTSSHDSRFMLSTRVARPRYPAITYSIAFSRDPINQILDAEWHHRDFVASVDYEWSTNRRAYGVKLAQRILNCQIWSSFQKRDLDVWQFGIMFPFPKYVRFRGFMNYSTRPDYVSHATGFELSSRFYKDLYLTMTYEYVRHNSTGDQFLSFSISKSFDFEQVGFSFVSGQVFMDVNSNGFFDVGDRPVPDVSVVLDNKSEVKTDEKGNYMFTFVRSGNHSVSLNLGCIPAEIGTAHRTQTIDTQALSQVRVNFPLEVLGSLSGTVYFDTNNNGEKDEDEAGVPNAVLALNGYLTTSDGSGSFRFANLAPGTYILEPKVLPRETVAAQQEVVYVYIQPGSHFADYKLGIVKKERPINKKIFD
jgi:hypothetical protein